LANKASHTVRGINRIGHGIELHHVQTDRVGHQCDDNGDGRCRLLRSVASDRNKNIDLEPDKLGQPFRPAIFEIRDSNRPLSFFNIATIRLQHRQVRRHAVGF